MNICLCWRYSPDQRVSGDWGGGRPICHLVEIYVHNVGYLQSDNAKPRLQGLPIIWVCRNRSGLKLARYNTSKCESISDQFY